MCPGNDLNQPWVEAGTGTKRKWGFKDIKWKRPWRRPNFRHVVDGGVHILWFQRKYWKGYATHRKPQVFDQPTSVRMSTMPSTSLILHIDRRPRHQTRNEGGAWSRRLWEKMDERLLDFYRKKYPSNLLFERRILRKPCGMALSSEAVYIK